MSKKLLFLILLILISCTKERALYKTDGVPRVESKATKIVDVTIVPWKVGAAFKKVISKGIMIKVKLPILSNSDRKKILREKGINSWIIRVKKFRLAGQSEILGYLQVPFIINFKRRKMAVGGGAIKHAFFQVNYAAAAISRRLENMYCPALGHRKIIRKVKIRDNGTRDSTFSITRNTRIQAKVNAHQVRPYTFNGGMSLRGDYVVELALYGTKRKMVYSNFVRLNQIVNASDERDVQLKECATFKIPPKPKDIRKRFKFGR
jgi:hypothetical protein